MLKSNKNIYMDYASSAPIDPRVFSIMAKIIKNNFANPSSIHSLGLEAKNILENCRKKIADIIGAHADEIVFTSGATESNNFAILGVVRSWKNKGLPHVITLNIEHTSVYEMCKFLEKEKIAEVTYIPVEKNGIVDPKKIKEAIRPNTVLVSVMYANNEIGTIQPIKEIAKEIRHCEKQSRSVLNCFFHTDATQAMNYLPINVEKLGVDMLSFNGSKIYGPKGVGVLYIKRNISLQKIMFGGSQENEYRPGTENLSGVVGITEALQITEKIKEKESARLKKLQEYFLGKLEKIGVTVNGDIKNRLPNNINITVPNIPSELLVIELSSRGIMVSGKSACKSGDTETSHVIKAVCKKGKGVDGSIRFSMGRNTTKKDIDYVLKSLESILLKLGKWYRN